MDLGLSGKGVIVTGGASNIGRAITLTFAREGANVAIADLDEPQAQKVAREAAASGVKTIVVKTDVTKLEEVQAMVDRVISEFGAVDVLVNNVGWDQLQLFIETTPEFWDRVIAINYRSVLNCIKTVLPHMIERRKGAIVSLGSDAGRVGEFREAVYSGCKAGIIGLTKAVAREVGRYGIRLNVVCPGVTVPGSPDEVGEMSMWRGGMPFTQEQFERMKAAYPLRKLGTPQDVAYAVVFLASDVVSGHITGQTLSVSGGYSMM